jgi:endoglucanase
MLSSSDWGISYSVGDKYDPSSASAGLVPTDVIIDGEGTYTVSLDMTANGGASGVAFSALGIANGEINFPNYVIEIKEIKINDSTVIPCENYYTTADDGKCTRVNLYNAWVPDAVNAISGNKNNELGRLAPGISADSVTATPIDPNFPETANTISITFDYYPAAE